MARQPSLFIQALNRSECKKDGGYKSIWGFGITDENEVKAEKKHFSVLIYSTVDLTMDRSDKMDSSEEGKKQSTLKPFCSGDTLKTYERRSSKNFKLLKGNAIGLNMLGAGKKLGDSTQVVNATSGNHRPKLILVSSQPPQGIVVQGRRFQHANIPAAVKTPAQSNLDLKERKEYPPNVQRQELDNIILTCPGASNSAPDGEIKRRIQQKRRSSEEGLDASESFTICGQCNKKSENHEHCENCGHSLMPISACINNTAKVNVTTGSLSRPPIHQLNAGPNHLHVNISSKAFYGTSLLGTSSNMDINKIMSLPIQITRTNLANSNGKPGLVLNSHNLSKTLRGRRQMPHKQHELNDPIVLSSDDEDEETENASTGSVSRMDSVSPRPADSARSSPTPSGGKAEAAMKDSTELAEQALSSIFPEAEPRIIIPRKARMKDQYGNLIPDKRRKVSQVKTPIACEQATNLESMILECRSIRIGSLRRAVTDPVIFTLDYIKVETETYPEDGRESIHLNTSEIICCEWCCAKKLPVIFFQTTPEACLRLQTQLKMTKEKGNGWYDCKGSSPDEQYIVLIFESGLNPYAQAMLTEIFKKIGNANEIDNFLVSIPFVEANKRLVRFISRCEEPSPKDKSSDSSIKPRMFSTHIRATAQFFDDDEETSDSQPVFSGPIEKLIVYPPPPAKGGISVTNEDLHCLNEGEFLNDVIIDFYLKYLFLEKLKNEGSERSHVFSSFFYKRLNQREKRSLSEIANLTIQQRKHNRVKTWTRHVDLFQKDFIFVPINESAHWFLAVICFPGLNAPSYEPNLLYRCPETTSNSFAGEDNTTSSEESSSKSEHCTLNSTPQNSQRSKVSKLSLSENNSNADFKKISSSSDVTQISRIAETQGSKTEQKTRLINGVSFKGMQHLPLSDGLQQIRSSYSDETDVKSKDDDNFNFSDDPDTSQDEESEDGAFGDDNLSSANKGQWHMRPTICKQPCILIMDSLRGPTRSTVVKTLREYLEVEWEARKGTKRSFNKDVMKGSSPRVPQQDNFSDCGVYILQYVESFFEKPIVSFDLPMNLTDWFPQQRMKKKREEIKELILRLQEQQQMFKKGHKDCGTGVTSSHNADIPGTSCSE
ncbi:sentrin-specific protease 6 isoform X2 [Polypterus senegalus]|uniref:sentrin-specific protease 6 isoform X2 n=1 Tax=Polypterus senegalus TaxID=55291 RepID=UPI001964750A|nr:sentrin-specific protease 6 isoform X2 [Polypterus senegalus]